MTDTGEKQYWLLNRNSNEHVVLHYTRYNGNYWYDEGYFAWGTIPDGHANVSKLRHSLVLSPDESHLMTFTTSTWSGRNSQKLECRLDVWDVSGLSLSVAD